MTVGDVEITFAGHATFLFRIGECRIVCDPYFAWEFPFEGHVERRLTAPRCKPEDLGGPDLVFISHSHGDHFDPDAVKKIASARTVVAAPAEVLEILASGDGGAPGAPELLSEDMDLRVNGVTLSFLAGYDNSSDKLGRQDKFSLLISSSEARIFYSGDCHEAPPRLKQHSDKLDRCILWPEDEAVARFVEEAGMTRMILMHGDRHEPGNFPCSMDYDAEKARLEKKFPGLEVRVPC